MTPFPHPFLSRTAFLTLAFVFEGGLALVGLILGWFVGIKPFAYLTFNWSALGWTVVGTLPLMLLFWVSYRFPIGPLGPIKRLLIETLGPYLDNCRYYDLLLIALLAGVCEELFFRGVLQSWIESIGGTFLGLIGSNLIFALAHFITRTYALLAGLMGVYLGLLLDAGEQRNLLTPMMVHTLYDLFAFLVVVRTFRLEQAHRHP
ncbi:CPBP family intramembrane glutamic endopeptidase [Nitrosococcus wardiae]|uniref:CPBP family intramembrane metalloprotease n=1 Tax=Nitrosococcus wardiae TaxID=1814290 RepID=A0A4P7C1Q3_9GAMM|nr:type II CAAX endopeptidase family protein [Nitrosococcus wardiae]QBQ56311.1 CPBP family intramembrane metalloprotease [Nitrosococcus wardiae]